MTSICYRDFRDEDLEAVAKVWLDSWRSIGMHSDRLVTEAVNRERIRSELQNGWHVTVAADGDRIIGFLATRPKEGVLDQLFITPDAKGRGIGTRLLELARTEMSGGFRLRAAEANRHACAFYESRGLRHGRLEPHPTFGHMTVIFLWP
jgi:ribosomal protein S18 acetylase RimI-like enzyme